MSDLAEIIVIKRDGKRVRFDRTKIAIAIKKGFDSVDGKYNEDDVNKVYNKVIEKIQKLNLEKIKIEEIQDLIEDELKLNAYDDVFTSFSEYREKRAQSREIFFEEKRKHKFLKALEKIGLIHKEDENQIKDNKNSMEIMEAYGKTVSTEFATSYLLKKKFSDAMENGDIYIDNIGFYSMGTIENVQIDIEKLFKDGFQSGNSFMREPKNIISYAMLAIIAISSTQNEQHGSVGIPAFDYYMAPGVFKTFKKEFRQTIYDILEYIDYDKFIAINGIDREIDKLSSIEFDIERFYKFTRESDLLKRMFRIAYTKALSKTEKQVYQAMEAFIHDLNSLCKRKITTINLGTDSSPEGRMITKNLLNAMERGIGENKKPISPIIVFKIKKGINYKKDNPNYDLLEYSIKLVKKISNISYSFLDSTLNYSYFKEGDFNTEVAYFYDGKRIIDNNIDSDKIIVSGRGVISTTVLNLPRIAIKAQHNLKYFFEELDNKMELVKDQLIARLDVQENKRVFNSPFIMSEGIWIDSERLHSDDKLKRILKQGILEIGFTGLTETLFSLTGSTNITDKKTQDIGIKIVSEMQKKAKEFSAKYNLNFEILGNTDSEIARVFLEYDRIIFGKIKDITDKEKYTISFYLPDNINENKKIEIESKYHELTNGGHCTEVKSNDVMKTIDLFEKNDICYGKISYIN